MKVKDEVDELTRNLYDEYMRIFSEFDTGEYELKFYVESASRIGRKKTISKSTSISNIFDFGEDMLHFSVGKGDQESLRNVVGTMVAYL